MTTINNNRIELASSLGFEDLDDNAAAAKNGGAAIVYDRAGTSKNSRLISGPVGTTITFTGTSLENDISAISVQAGQEWIFANGSTDSSRNKSPKVIIKGLRNGTFVNLEKHRDGFYNNNIDEARRLK